MGVWLYNLTHCVITIILQWLPVIGLTAISSRWSWASWSTPTYIFCFISYHSPLHSLHSRHIELSVPKKSAGSLLPFGLRTAGLPLPGGPLSAGLAPLLPLIPIPSRFIFYTLTQTILLHSSLFWLQWRADLIIMPLFKRKIPYSTYLSL